MAESKELGFSKPVIGLKEQLARTTLRNLRSQGHTYIELREDGKRFVFFCTLCLAPCYSDTILLGHLNGNLHKERFSCARITLLGQNPWPFNDGVLFFDSSTGEEEKPLITDADCVTGPLQHCSDDERFAIVKYNGNGINGSYGDDRAAVDTDDEPSRCADDLLISGLLIKERTLDVEAKFIGFGRIAGRLFETKGRATWVDKLWCEWLGDEGPSDQEKATVPEHDFAIVTFSYFYNLGRLGLLDDPRRFLISNQPAVSGNGEDDGRKRKMSFSDPEDTSDSLCSQYDSSEEDSSARNSRALIAGYDDHLVNKRLIKNKTVRRELRKQQRIFSERICEVCKQKLLPGKDAAAILNTKTGNLACSSRNRLGAFHLFHVSCVIHWFLFCENEILGSKMVRGKGKGKGKKRCTKQSCGVKWNGLVSDVSWQIFSVFCPECQGTGIDIEGDVIERDTFPLSQTWRFGVKVSEGRKAWVKNPEKLENCSTGFHFPRPDEESVKGQEERVQSMKLVRFYRVEL